MIECIFTIDYEIYGNGEGSLNEHVYTPAERLATIFRKWNVRFVSFVEVAELEMMETEGTDPAIDLVKQQMQNFYKDGFELGLHIHPQWYNAHYESGRWLLDYSEYNLCTLPQERITDIVNRSVTYMQNTLKESKFIPLSFRAGNWLFQPTKTAARVLAETGIKIDSSVFKGGLQHQHSLDYRRCLKNGYYWTFSEQVDVPDPNGTLLELPTHTKMVPIWKMLTTKRINMQRRTPSSDYSRTNHLLRLKDFLRFSHPLKLDFCRMTMDELTRMIDGVIKEDKESPDLFKPIVIIGHTKDLVDFETVESFLLYLLKNGIKVSTFGDVYKRCIG